MNRRHILKLAGGLVSATAFGKLVFQEPLAHASPPDLQPISFEDFRIRLHELAAEFLTNPKGEEAYLYAVAALLKRVSSFPELSFGNPLDLKSGAKFYRGKPENSVSINKLTFDPNGYLMAHDHRLYVGILICLEGRLQCRNFNIVSDNGTEAVIQRMCDVVLNAGDVAIILQGKGNVHDLKSFDQFVNTYDIYTYMDKAAATKWLNIDESTWDSSQQTYKAKWQNTP